MGICVNITSILEISQYLHVQPWRILTNWFTPRYKPAIGCEKLSFMRRWCDYDDCSQYHDCPDTHYFFFSSTCIQILSMVAMRITRWKTIKCLASQHHFHLLHRDSAVAFDCRAVHRLSTARHCRWRASRSHSSGSGTTLGFPPLLPPGFCLVPCPVPFSLCR